MSQMSESLPNPQTFVIVTGSAVQQMAVTWKLKIKDNSFSVFCTILMNNFPKQKKIIYLLLLQADIKFV